jgi:hypothetical protein
MANAEYTDVRLEARQMPQGELWIFADVRDGGLSKLVLLKKIPGPAALKETVSLSGLRFRYYE